MVAEQACTRTWNRLGITSMKKLILSISLTVFAIVAAQADDAKAPKTAKGKDCTSCCADKNAKQVKSTADCSSCCKETASKSSTMKLALLSPKAAAEVRR